MPIPPVTRPPDDPRNGPVHLRQHLLEAGLDDDDIRAMVRRGELCRIRRGAFVDPATLAAVDPEGLHLLRARAALGQARTPMVLSHVTGLVELGSPSWGFDLTRVHLSRTDGLGGRRWHDVHVHNGTLHAGDLVRVNGVPVMSPARLVIESLSHRAPEATLAAANHLLHAGLLSETDLHAQLAPMHPWPDTALAEIVVRLADGRLESVAESRFLWFTWRHGFPKPVPQHEVRDAGGRLVGRLDFAWPDHGVWVEVDGRAKYVQHLRQGEAPGDAVFREKRREDEIRRVTGWRCLRVTWADLESPRRLAALVAQMLAPAAA